ncbi:MAG: hypothetical protein IJH25_07190, partial [Clostridia bacterium]|nr:hypothetical protein [Clostridia bacterium]
IARHIVWNLAACNQKVTIDTAGGIFLQPNDDSEIEIKGTTAGWIVSDGYVYNGTAEWHNVYEEMPETVSVNLYALKYLDGKLPSQEKKFTFKLEKLAFTYHEATGIVDNKHFETLQQRANNDYSLVRFDSISQDQLNLGWNVFKITETGVADGTEGTYITDKSEYYAAVLLQATVIPGKERTDPTRIVYTVSAPRYYTSFDPDQFELLGPERNINKPNPVLTGMGGERVAVPVFKNETVSTGLTLMKRVNGSEDTTKKFTFGIDLWTETTNGSETTRSALSTEQLSNTTVEGGSWAVHPATVDDHTHAEIELKNGRKATIKGLTEGVHYAVKEIKIDGVAIDYTAEELERISGYLPLPVNEEGEDLYTVIGAIDDVNKAYSETFFNDYQAAGEIDLNVVKTLKDETGGDMALADHMFAFTLSGGKTPIQGYNDENGKVWFVIDGEATDRLSFDQSDMTGAKKDEDKHLVKEVTFVIHEGKGTMTQAQIEAYNVEKEASFSYDSVVYEDDKAVTLVLTDMGNGVIQVAPKVGTETALSASFDNHLTKKADATLQGKKIMEGRDMTKGEFIFNAKLIQVDETDVSDAAISAASTDEAKQALYALRKQASPVNVIGVNETVSAHDAGEGNENKYTSNFSFPVIRYTVPGTYKYEITEETASMPEDARQKESSETKYYATVTVDDQMQSSVAYTKDNGTSLDLSAVPEFVNETKTVGFDVTKKWNDKDDNPVGESRFITFSLTRNGQRVDVSGLTVGTNITNTAQNSAGTITVDATDNVIKLESDASGNWPIAHFTGMPAGRYVIREESHTSLTGGLKTTYTVIASDETDPDKAANSNIVREGQVLTITNKETRDTNTSIRVEKKWKAGDTEYVPATGSASFELWEKKTTGGSSSVSGNSVSIKIEQLNYNTILTGTVGQ